MEGNSKQVHRSRPRITFKCSKPSNGCITTTTTTPQNQPPSITKASEDDSKSCNKDKKCCCFICGETFALGKGLLFDHMSIHWGATSYYNTEDDSKSCNKNKKTSCPICGEIFTLGKGLLFNHVRSHWEILSCEATTVRCSTSFSDSEESSKIRLLDNNLPSSSKTSSAMKSPETSISFDLPRSIPKWSTTAKRGREAIKKQELEPNTVVASEKLNKRKQLEDAETADKNNKKRKIDHESKANQEVSEIKKDQKARKYNELVGCRAIGAIVNCLLESYTTGQNYESYTTDQNNFECDTCSKSFSSHQALGAHKSSHGKGQNSAIQVAPSDSIELTSEAAMNCLLESHTTDQNSFKCDTCNESFSSHQALKGHKSSHGKGQNSAIQVVPSDDRELTSEAAINCLLESHTTDQNSFKCDICNKCFSSHQALGGHKSSHGKVQNSATQASPSEDIEFSKAFMNSNINFQKHRCKICNKSFRKGQALGGHMRMHWEPLLAPTSISNPGIASPVHTPTNITDLSSKPPVQTSTRRELNIDLNEPIHMEEESIGITESVLATHQQVEAFDRGIQLFNFL